MLQTRCAKHFFYLERKKKKKKCGPREKGWQTCGFFFIFFFLFSPYLSSYTADRRYSLCLPFHTKRYLIRFDWLEANTFVLDFVKLIAS